MMAIQQDHRLEEQALVAAMQTGDKAAWDQFAEQYGRKLHDYLQHNLRTAEDVDDLWSDVMVAAVQSIREFSHESSLSTWLYSIAYRKVADYWRRQKQTSTIGQTRLVDESFSEIMTSLPEQAQQVLLLRYYVGMSVAEIAEVLGRSSKATESLLQRVRQQFHATSDIAVSLVPPNEPAHDEPTHNESAQSHEQLAAKSVFGAAYPMILLQKQLCQQQGMTAEATIFARAQQQLEQLSIVSTDDLFTRLQFIESIFKDAY